MNLNFIELLTILQLITIRNSSDGNNIKPQAIKTLVKFLNIQFFIFDSRKFNSYIIFFLALERTKNNILQPLAQKGCVPLVYMCAFRTILQFPTVLERSCIT